METLSKQRVSEIISKAPKGTQPQEIINGLVSKGYKLEGYNEPKSVFSQSLSGISKGMGETIKGAMSTSETLLKEGAKQKLGQVIPGGSMIANKLLPQKSATEAIQTGIEKLTNKSQGTLLKANTPIEKIAKTVTEIASMFIPLGESSAVSKVGQLIKPSEAQKLKSIVNEIMPKLTKIERESALKQGRSVVGNVLPKESDIKAANLVKDLVKPGKPEQSIYNIRKAVTDEANSLITSLKNNNFLVPKQEIISTIDKATKKLSESPTIVGDAETTANRLLNKAKQIIQESKGDAVSLLKSRQKYDAWVLSQKPKAFDANTSNAFTIANKAVRDAFGNILKTKAQNAGIQNVSESLNKQHQMLNVMDNLVKKSEELVGKGKLERFKIQNPKSYKVLEKAGLIGLGYVGIEEARKAIDNLINK